MGIHVQAINGMGASTIVGSVITNTGMKAEDHMAVSEDFVSNAGIVKVTDLLVAQNGTPNMSINVGAGVGYILNPAWTSTSLTETKYWRLKNSADVNVAITSNSSGNPRITSIFAKIDTSATPNDDADNVASFVAVNGTAAASPTAPAAPSDGNGYLRLADITVADGATSIVTANIAAMATIATPNISSGWTSLSNTAAYQSADSPSFVMRFASVDMTGIISVGMKVRLKQGGAYKYFIVTAIAFSTNTDVTLYGGTDYTLTNATITDLYISSSKAPLNFPINPGKWSVTLNSSSFASQATPSANTWYNIGTKSLIIPIGVWDLSYSVNLTAIDTTNATLTIYTTLSTANNSESDSTMTANAQFKTGTSDAKQWALDLQRTKLVPLELAAKATYYLNEKVLEAGADSLSVDGGARAFIKAVCVYL
jgi:hypothetical protein